MALCFYESSVVLPFLFGYGTKGHTPLWLHAEQLVLVYMLLAVPFLINHEKDNVIFYPLAQIFI